MPSYHKHLHRGFNWLGAATVIAKVVDLTTLLGVLLFLTKEQVGVASLVIAIATVVEAFDGLGSREALVQAQAISREQLDSLFWFIIGASTAIALIVLLAAPFLGAFYGISGMALYFIAVAAKQPIVGAALIPLAMMNRDLQYERIAIINVCATFAAAFTRLALAVSGGGVWALVAGYCGSGLYSLIGAQIAKPFWPRLRLRLGEIFPLVHFGLRAVILNFLEQLLKNVDALLIGWFYGPSQLAVYRVAFTVAMEPAMAVGTLINRTALPIFARAARIKDQLTHSLLWSLRRLVLLIAPLTVAVILAATPITNLIHDGQGHSYAAAAFPLKLLAIAALLRVTSQLFYPVALGAGRPATAARLSAVTLLLLSVSLAFVGWYLPAQTGIVAVSGIWVALYPLLLIWESRYLRQHWAIQARDLAGVFLEPAIGALALATTVSAVHWWVGDKNPVVQLGFVLAAAALTYTGLILHARQKRFRTT